MDFFSCASPLFCNPLCGFPHKTKPLTNCLKCNSFHNFLTGWLLKNNWRLRVADDSVVCFLKTPATLLFLKWCKRKKKLPWLRSKMVAESRGTHVDRVSLFSRPSTEQKLQTINTWPQECRWCERTPCLHRCVFNFGECTGECIWI